MATLTTPKSDDEDGPEMARLLFRLFDPSSPERVKNIHFDFTEKAATMDREVLAKELNRVLDIFESDEFAAHALEPTDQTGQALHDFLKEPDDED